MTHRKFSTGTSLAMFIATWTEALGDSKFEYATCARRVLWMKVNVYRKGENR